MTNSIAAVIFRIVIALVLTFIVLAFASSAVMSYQKSTGDTAFGSWVVPLINHGAMLIISIIIILILSRGRISAYGFRWPESLPTIGLIFIPLVVGIMTGLVQSLIPGKALAFAEKFSFIQIVTLVWVLASIAEEVLTRGMVQGYLLPLENYGFNIFHIRITVPNLTAAIIFAAMHLALLAMGADIAPVITIVIFAFIIGIIAGYYRGITASIIPAIFVHMLGNIGGWLGGLVAK